MGVEFDPDHVAQLGASAASAGLARADAVAVPNELERLRAQVAEWLPWATAAADATVEITTGERHFAAWDLLARIEAGEFGEAP
jgi:hypothetical protein